MGKSVFNVEKNISIDDWLAKGNKMPKSK